MKLFLASLIAVCGLTAARGEVSETEARDELAKSAAAAYAAKDWQAAESAFKKLVKVDPRRWDYAQGLGNAQLNLGHYEDALVALDQGIALAEPIAGGSSADAAKAKNGLGQMLTDKGNILVKQKKVADAIAADEKAATVSSNPGAGYFNLCATLFNQGRMKDAAAECDKAIAADPAKADAYFIKGSALFGEGELKDGKYIVSQDTVNALRRYLALAPGGSHATDVKSMLDSLKQPVSTTYQKRARK